MSEKEYELLPHKLLADLKYDVEALKKKLMKPDAKANELILEIESMKDSTHELTVVFQRALEEMKGDEDFSKTIKNLNEKITTLVSQDETIARGMVALSDKVDELIGNHGPLAPPLPINQHKQTVIPPTAPTIPPTTPIGAPTGFPPPPKVDEDKKRTGLFR